MASQARGTATALEGMGRVVESLAGRKGVR